MPKSLTASPIWRSRRVFTLLSTNIPLRLQTLLQLLQLRERRLRFFGAPTRTLAHDRDDLGPAARLQQLKHLAPEFARHAAAALGRIERALHVRQRPVLHDHRPRAAARLQERDQ